MPLQVGSRLGHYDVTALIDEGGMGEVYRASDTKLDRDVALKVLPQAFTDDPDRLKQGPIPLESLTGSVVWVYEGPLNWLAGEGQF